MSVFVVAADTPWRAARLPPWVASGYRAHTGPRPLHLAKLSLSSDVRELTTRADRRQASRGHLRAFADGRFRVVHESQCGREHEH